MSDSHQSRGTDLLHRFPVPDLQVTNLWLVRLVQGLGETVDGRS